VLARQRNGLSPGSGLPYHHHVWLRTDDAQESDTHYRVIVGNQHPNDAGIGSFSNRGWLRAVTRKGHEFRQKGLYTKRPVLARAK
jgi:hypothetical protein